MMSKYSALTTELLQDPKAYVILLIAPVCSIIHLCTTWSPPLKVSLLQNEKGETQGDRLNAIKAQRKILRGDHHIR